ncbi:MAG: hypothetical protein LBF60_03795 [Treponema sp.]|jgi:hypothetical protein|nr:hypothetical protein [Treponema sp.]
MQVGVFKPICPLHDGKDTAAQSASRAAIDSFFIMNRLIAAVSKFQF